MRELFRPSWLKLTGSIIATIATYYLVNSQTVTPEKIGGSIPMAKSYFSFGAVTAFLMVGSGSPFLKVFAIIVVFLIISWIVYLVVWFLESMIKYFIGMVRGEDID